MCSILPRAIIIGSPNLSPIKYAAIEPVKVPLTQKIKVVKKDIMLFELIYPSVDIMGSPGTGSPIYSSASNTKAAALPY